MAAATGLTPTERTLRARSAAFSMHAAGRTNTGPARAAALARFENQVDPDRKLPQEERTRRAEQARRAYFAALALKSSKVRRQRATARRQEEPRPDDSPAQAGGRGRRTPKASTGEAP